MEESQGVSRQPECCKQAQQRAIKLGSSMCRCDTCEAEFYRDVGPTWYLYRETPSKYAASFPRSR
jgi:hypothetical protein